MPHRSTSTATALFLAVVLTACASTTAGGGGTSAEESASSETRAPATPLASTDAAARARAQTWLDAAALPPGAVRSEASLGGFDSYTGWPCVPVEELEAFWTIPGATVHDTADWLIENPTADLMTTAVGPVVDDPAIDSATVGFIPEPVAQEGVVYTILKTDAGVAVRAEVAALTESAACQTLPDDGTWGAPGQG